MLKSIATDERRLRGNGLALFKRLARPDPRNGGSSSKCRCRIWQGGMLSHDGISDAEGPGHYNGNNFNESLAPLDDRSVLYLTSLMGIGFGRLDLSFDLKRVSKEQAAEYLWRRFVAPLER